MLLLFLNTVAALAQPVQPDTGEAIFSNALAYTVQIKAAIPIPFDGDNKGFGTGSGFVVDRERGWVMTNAHVVSRSPARIEVAFYEGEFGEAKKLYVDPFLDLAILDVGERARAKGIENAPLDCGESPRVGHPVGAFGHPWGLKYTGTRGIISGVTARHEQELLQTDAPINPGNSGGPLISAITSKVVGINTASYRGSQNTNMAVAMKYACRVLQVMREGGDPSPPDLPLIYFKDLDEKKVLRVAKSYLEPGLLSLQPRDIIKEVVDAPGKIDNETQLFDKLRGRLDRVNLIVEREGREIQISGKLKSMPRVTGRSGTFVSGILFGPVQLRDATEINVSKVYVHFVEIGSAGQFSEIQRGDFLEELDEQAVKSHQQLYGLLEKAQQENRTVTLKLRRFEGGRGIFTYLERKLRVAQLEMIEGEVK